MSSGYIAVTVQDEGAVSSHPKPSKPAGECFTREAAPSPERKRSQPPSAVLGVPPERAPRRIEAKLSVIILVICRNTDCAALTEIIPSDRDRMIPGGHLRKRDGYRDHGLNQSFSDEPAILTVAVATSCSAELDGFKGVRAAKHLGLKPVQII